MASALLPVVKPKPWQVPLVLLVGAFGGALPDVDAISQWSGFDATIGRWFGLAHEGSDIYYNQFWYSHHGITHSILGMLLLTGVFLLIMRVCLPKRKRKWNWTFALPFMLAYFAHILEDLPTPGSVWEGVMLFCPFRPWVGGTGDIWWWHNYDLFLLFLLCFVLNTLIHSISRWVPSLKRRMVTVWVFGAMVVLSVVQIARREYDYDYVNWHREGYNKRDAAAIEFQRKVLGDDLTDFMLEVSEKTPVPF